VSDIPVTIVANSLIEDVWYQVTPLLLKGEKYLSDYYTLDDIKFACIDGSMQLWVGVNGEISVCAITTIDVYPQANILRFIYCGGKGWRNVAYAHAAIVEYAKKYKCIGIDIVARDGWWKLLTPFGYKKRAVYLVKRFEEN